MKQVIRNFLLFGLVLGVIGWYPTYFVIKWNNKRLSNERKQTKHANEPLFLIQLNEQEYADLNWVEDDEFLFNGVMYDVFGVERNEDGVSLLCYADQRDSNLIEELIKRKKQEKEKSNQSLDFVCYALTHQREFLSLHTFQFPPCELVLDFKILKESRYQSFISEIIPPPPKQGQIC